MSTAELHHREIQPDPLRRLLTVPLEQTSPGLPMLLLKQNRIKADVRQLLRELKFISRSAGAIKVADKRAEYITKETADSLEQYITHVWQKQHLRRKTTDAMSGEERGTYVRWVAAVAASELAEEGKHTNDGSLLETMRAVAVMTLENGIKYGHEAATGESAQNYTLSAYEKANVQGLATEALMFGERKVTPAQLKLDLAHYVSAFTITSPSTTGPVAA